MFSMFSKKNGEESSGREKKSSVEEETTVWSKMREAEQWLLKLSYDWDYSRDVTKLATGEAFGQAIKKEMKACKFAKES